MPINTYNEVMDCWDEVYGSADISTSRVTVDSLRNWLRSRGVRTGFFFPEGTEAPEFLDPLNPRYAPKLAAAIPGMAGDGRLVLAGWKIAEAGADEMVAGACVGIWAKRR